MEDTTPTAELPLGSQWVLIADFPCTAGETSPLGPRKLVRGASVAGWVAQEDGTPAEKCRVRLEPVSAPGRPNDPMLEFLRSVASEAPCQKKGFFQFSAVAAGSYTLVAQELGHQTEALMKFQRILALTIVLALPVVLMAAQTRRPEPASYSTMVTIEPLGTGFALKAEVKDAASGEVVAGPMLKLPSGETGDTETILESGEKVLLTATIDSVSRTASYTITVKQGDRVVAEHSAKVAL
jgi:hypothetical protein